MKLLSGENPPDLLKGMAPRPPKLTPRPLVIELEQMLDRVITKWLIRYVLLVLVVLVVLMAVNAARF